MVVFNLEVTHAQVTCAARVELKTTSAFNEEPKKENLAWKAEENGKIIPKIADFQVKMGSFLGNFALRALNPTFSCGKSLVATNQSLQNVFGRECDSNHTILSTQKCPSRSEKYFFTFFSQKWVILRGAPRLEERIPCENNGRES